MARRKNAMSDNDPGNEARTWRQEQDPPPDLIVRTTSPEVLEFPFASLNTFLIPNDRFFVRSHFPTPTVNVATWRLRVEGAVQTPLEFTYEDLLGMSSRT